MKYFKKNKSEGPSESSDHPAIPHNHMRYGLHFLWILFIILWCPGCQYALKGQGASGKTPEYQDGQKMKPLLFDVRANELPAEGVPIIKPWKRIALDPEYAGGWIVAGDVDGDGQAEIVSARNVNENDNHYTCSVVAQRLDGTVVWRWGDPGIGRYEIHHDVACQIYDWDGDGKNEVVVAAKERVVEIDGATGMEKQSFAIPPDASDCIVFANLSGAKRACEILVKTRYNKIWAYERTGRLLWAVEKPAGYKTAHQPYPIDIDHDGKDEILAGYALLNPDGSVRWKIDDRGINLTKGHLDCARIFRTGKKPSASELVLTLCGGNRLVKISGEGNLIWSIEGLHFESIDIGRFCSNRSGKQIIVDVDHCPNGESPLWILDENGNLLGRIVTNRSRRHLLIDWLGNRTESLVIGSAVSMFDDQGNKTAIFDTPASSCFKGDMTGDHVPDLIFLGNKEVYIFKNEKGKASDDYKTLGTGTNFTLY